MSQSVSKRFVIYALVGVVIAAVIVVTPSLFEQYAASKIQDRARASGVDVSWDELDLQWTGKAIMRGVELEAPSRGLEARSDIITLHVDLGSLLSGEPKLSGVGAAGTVARWDPTSTTSKGGEGDGASGGSRFEQTIEELDFLNVIDTTVVVESGGESAEILINSVSVDDGFVQGRARWEALSLPGGLGVREQDCSFRGEWTGGLEPLDLELSAANNEPILTVTRGSNARLEVQKMTVRLEPEDRYARLDLRDVEALLGAEDSPLATFEAPVATFAISAQHRPAAAVFSPTFTVDPAQWKSARAEGGARDPGADADASPGHAGAAVLAALQKMELVVEEGAVDLILGGRRLEIVEDLGMELLGQQVVARGRSAGGSFAMNLGFGGTTLVPESIHATFDGVRLGAIPGMNEGRTLPKRGFRGRLGGVLDASVTLVREEEGGLLSSSVLSVDADWRDGTVDIAGLAEEPLEGISGSLSFDSDIRPGLGVVDIRAGRATYGPLAVAFDGSITDWPLDTTFEMTARLEEIACQKAVRSLPDTLLGAYRDVEIDGSAGPKFAFTLPWNDPENLELSMEGFVDKCEVTALNTHEDGWPEVRFARRPPTAEPNPSVPVAPLPEGRKPSNLDDVYWLNRPFVMRVTEGVSEDAEVKVGPGLESYVPLHELPDYVGAAAYLSEEINFYENHAVDLGHIEKALRMNLEGGEFVYGGSTVDQQLVKNLFLSRDKTLARKLREALIAWRMEGVVSKDRILELYLNCIEYGDDLYGIGPAAQYYFGKDARELTPEEATLLAIIKPAPWYGERFKRKGTTPTEHWWFDRMGEIMGRLVEKEFISAAEAEMAKPYVLQWDEEGAYLPQEDAQEDDGETWDLFDMDGGGDDEAAQDGEAQ